MDGNLLDEIPECSTLKGISIFSALSNENSEIYNGQLKTCLNKVNKMTENCDEIVSLVKSKVGEEEFKNKTETGCKQSGEHSSKIKKILSVSGLEFIFKIIGNIIKCSENVCSGFGIDSSGFYDIYSNFLNSLGSNSVVVGDCPKCEQGVEEKGDGLNKEVFNLGGIKITTGTIVLVGIVYFISKKKKSE